MREIKFRAWDKKSKNMIILNGTAFGDVYDNGKKQFEIMQFTGFKDKNGVKIYEGDIFDCIYKGDGCQHKSVVVWRITTASFILRACGECDQPNVTQTLSDAERHEVIGNTYENPELLEITASTGDKNA